MARLIDADDSDQEEEVSETVDFEVPCSLQLLSYYFLMSLFCEQVSSKKLEAVQNRCFKLGSLSTVS